jgi:hypothetical protein
METEDTTIVSFALEPDGVWVMITWNSRDVSAPETTGAENRTLAVLEAESATDGPAI